MTPVQSPPRADETEGQAPPPSPPSSAAEEETVATGQASPAPEAHDEVPLEGGDTGARGAGAEEEDSPPSP